MERQKRRKRKANGANGRRRINNTGTLEPRGNKWLARWYVYNEQGKRIRKSQILNVTGIDEARTKLKELTEGNALITREKVLERTQRELEGVRAERKAWVDGLPALPIPYAWEAYLASPHRKSGKTGEGTLSNYEGYFHCLEKWLETNRKGMTELREVSMGDAQTFINELAQTRSAQTVNKYIVFFTKFWRVLAKDDADKDPQANDPAKQPAKLSGNPWAEIEHHEENSNTRRELSVEELGRVISGLDGEMRILFAIGIYTGARLGDCALLEWGMVDMIRRRISFIPRKTKRHAKGKQTVIPLHDGLFAVLQETPSKERTGYVLPEIARTYLRDRAAITDRIQRHFRNCGIITSTKREGENRAQVQVGFHSLRHTFVSMSANAGTPLAVVQAIVGHSNPAMTQHYFHESETALRGAVAALPNVIHQSPDGQATAIDAATIPTGRETAKGLPLGESGEKSRLEAFKAAFLALTTVERESAEKWIAENRNTVNVA